MKVKNRLIVLAVTLWSFLLIATTPSALAAAGITEKEAYEIGIEAYPYFYPLISTDVTRRIQTNMPAGVKSGFGPMNTFIHAPAFPTAELRIIVRPNFDTLYSTAWLI